MPIVAGVVALWYVNDGYSTAEAAQAHTVIADYSKRAQFATPNREEKRMPEEVRQDEEFSSKSGTSHSCEMQTM